MSSILNTIKKFPDSPGVYFFLGRQQGGLGRGSSGPKAPSARAREILYVGKATSLRSRGRSYFNGKVGETRGPLIEKLLELVTKVTFEKTDSVLEAVILEAH